MFLWELSNTQINNIIQWWPIIKRHILIFEFVEVTTFIDVVDLWK